MQEATSYITYLINLDRSPDRLEKMKTEFSKAHLDFERISAVDARTLDETSYRVDNRYDRDLMPGEIGCYLSHIKTLQSFLKTDYEFALIIEDDAILPENLTEKLNKALNQYATLKKKHQWDVLKLNSRKRYIKIQDLDETHFLGASGTSIPITTIAAVWTRTAAEKFLKVAIENGKAVIKRPIDCDLQHPWEYDLLIYSLLPSLITNSGDESIINENRKLRKSKFGRQLKYELNRLLPKYQYYISRHGFVPFFKSFIYPKTKKI